MNGNAPRQKQSFVNDYAGVYPLRIIRSQTISLLLLPNLLLLIAAFADPFVPVWAWLLLVPLAVMDILGLAVVISPGKMQEFHLFVLGAIGILGSAAFAAAANKLAYATLDISSPWFLIGSAVGYIVVFALLYGIHMRLLYSGYYSREEQEKPDGDTRGLRKTQGIILASSGAKRARLVRADQNLRGIQHENNADHRAAFFVCSCLYHACLSNLHKFYLLRKRR